MPYKQNYNRKTVGNGGSQTPTSVMGSQGKSVSIKPGHYVNFPTGKTPFPGSSKSK